MGKGKITDHELKRLSRADLLELLIAESRENEQLRSQVEEMKQKLESREIELQNVGSIAEAALRLNGVFEAAEKAAQQYLENIRRLAGENHNEKES